MAMTQGPGAALALHGHTFEAISPQKTLKYQDSGGMPNSCALSCHASRVDVFGLGMTSDLHTWDKPFDQSLANVLQQYFGPDGTWWKVDVGASSSKATTTQFGSKKTGLKPTVHHRVPRRVVAR